jgi:hypothetical protein
VPEPTGRPPVGSELAGARAYTRRPRRLKMHDPTSPGLLQTDMRARSSRLSIPGLPLARPSLVAARTPRRGGAQNPRHQLAPLLQHDSLLGSLRRGLGIASGKAAGPLTQRHLPLGPETRSANTTWSNPQMLGSRTTPTSYYGRCLPNLAPRFVDVGRFLGSRGSTSFFGRTSR